MSLVENIISQVSTKGLNGIAQPFGIDMQDDTFSKLLEKQLNSTSSSASVNLVGNMGVPAGLIIEPMNGVEFSETAQEQLEVLGESRLISELSENNPIEIKDMDFGDYFSNLLKSSADNNTSSDFMNFARKNATNAYNVFSKNFIDDMQDFVEDITSSL